MVGCQPPEFLLNQKFKYDPELGLFKLAHVLLFDFGSLPSTQGDDGDQLDVLVLLDKLAFVGCLVPARLIGVIEAEQTFEGKITRNDRFLAVAADSSDHQAVHTIEQIDAHLLGEIDHFFISYNMLRGKQFTPLGRAGPVRARQMIEEGRQAFADRQ